ncbi:hypothetical protein TKK_0015090 [Trichogramma kaykai]|uniref:Ubiquitin-like modifier-activating enzyme ATG7 n=1 Tax=Trichogramma kaykai TaxID=54128 RepID=A0ABD2WB53_9HYME
MSEDDQTVKFAKLRCAPEPSFWAKFAELKIDKFKLDENIKIPLWGSYNLEETGHDQPLFLDYTSFNDDLETTTHKSSISCRGYMINTNTLESYKSIDMKNFLKTNSEDLLNSMKDGTAVDDPSKLMIFLLLCFSDLKKYKFYYWAAHPAPFDLPEMLYAEPHVTLLTKFPQSLLDNFKDGLRNLSTDSKGFFSVIIEDSNILKVKKLSDAIALASKKDEKITENIYYAFYDPCSSAAPGWPLRNLLSLLFIQCPYLNYQKGVKFISVRGFSGKDSVIFTIKTKDPVEQCASKILDGNLVGWETNVRGKMGPNIADLSESMNPSKLFDRAVSLNLKLMKWRLVPDLDLDCISNLRCLLLGAGTLGCSVSRILLGWGVQNITFVDNSVVSLSNTVRQSLYTYEDAMNRLPKVEAAKNALLRINPNLKVEGVNLQIPMPGHVVGASLLEPTKQAIAKLEELYTRHDVVFLLLDSREARWLPTVMCASYGLVAINAALGFDSYTVQRHGTRHEATSGERNESPGVGVKAPAGKDLGCYFCNDVTQPGNSQADRTLDQQCTVSRPGLSNVAGGLAVELMIALMQHEDRAEARPLLGEAARAYNSSPDPESLGLLGGVPHTIRGSLSTYETMLTVTHRFASCTACSAPVLAEYKARKGDFVLDACNQPNYLEKLSGLNELFRPDLDELCCALDSDDED